MLFPLGFYSNSAKQSSGEALGWEGVPRVCTGGKAEHPRVCVNTVRHAESSDTSSPRDSPAGRAQSLHLGTALHISLWRHRHNCLTNRSTLDSSCCHFTARLCPERCPVPTCSTQVCWNRCHHVTAFPTAKCNLTGPGGFGRLLEHHPYKTFSHSRVLHVHSSNLLQFQQNWTPGSTKLF